MEEPTTLPAAERVVVRDARPAELAAVQAIYAHHVLQGLASFEERAPDVDEMRRRFDDISARGLPYLVGCIGEAIAGYGYCAPYRARSAYRYVLEDSVYVDPAYQRRSRIKWFTWPSLEPLNWGGGGGDPGEFRRGSCKRSKMLAQALEKSSCRLNSS